MTLTKQKSQTFIFSSMTLDNVAILTQINPWNMKIHVLDEITKFALLHFVSFEGLLYFIRLKDAFERQT